ncbi:MAG: CpsD/CapB family tyrosine-protein kinase [Aerococcus sp.]|nr:CpsD/CapB family tyrosine-protein kinase [Aerococcus sp.]
MFNREEREIEKKNREQHLGSSLITLMDPMSVVSEQFRTIRTNIQLAMVKNNYRSLMFTSSGAWEGKSMVASNVAVSMSHLDNFRVLFIDGDLRKPTAHKTFDIHTRRGLTTYLTDRSVEYMSITQYIPEANLYVIPAGPTPPNPAELLSSDRMKELLTETGKIFDLVIIDTPPILVVTDAQLIANVTDAAVFVLREGVAQRRDIYKSKQLLDKAHAQVVGAVYNGAEGNAVNSYYGYGYGDDLQLDD